MHILGPLPRYRTSKSGVGPRNLHFNKCPGESDIDGLQTTEIRGGESFPYQMTVRLTQFFFLNLLTCNNLNNVG